MKSFAAKSLLLNALILVCVPGCVLTTTSLRSAIIRESVVATHTALGAPVVVQAQAEEPVAKEGTALTEHDLVDQVLARNPTLAQMTAAWQAAMVRVPQVSSWDDPMFAGAVAPPSFGSRSVDSAYRVELSQKIYFPGKLRLKGQSAASEASASGSDVDDMRLQLKEAARVAFYEYYLADRALAVNDEGLKLLDEFRKNADSRFKQGQVPQQDIFQADVEIGRQRERRLTLERMQNVARARINTLMHLSTMSALPPPADAKPDSMVLPAIEQLQTQAVRTRPDVKALAERIDAEEALYRLAQREFYPDFEIAGAYDSIMGNGPARDMAPQVALKMNLPVRLPKRQAAVQEALHKIAQKRAELAARVDQVNFQVQEAYEQLAESDKILKLYDATILPAARANKDAAQSAYTTGKAPFVTLIEAQRNYVGLRDRYYETVADFFKSRANLDRAIGQP